MTTTAAPAAKPLRGLFSKVYHGILTDKAQLPSMPHVALRIRAAMQQKNFTAEKAARVIEADAGTSAYLIAVANSALYRGRVPITNVQNSVSRFGMEITRNLVMSYALRAMFTTRSPVLARLLQNTWRDGARLAALSSIMAKRCSGFVPDQAMLGGLLQDIGILPLLKALDHSKQSITDPNRVLATVESYANKVGPVLLEHWGFDESIVEVARSRKDWLRDPAPTADLADLILVARLHAGVGTAEQNTQPHINQVPAFNKLPLGDVGPGESLLILQEAETDVQDVMKMLGV
ncbi:MAG: HDOD domain-containing protein [Gammaproteobacteria bacterium]